MACDLILDIWIFISETRIWGEYSFFGTFFVGGLTCTIIDINIDIDNFNTDAFTVNSVHACFICFRVELVIFPTAKPRGIPTGPVPCTFYRGK